MEVKAQSVEASGPLLSAARGEAAPVRLLVTRPTVVARRRRRGRGRGARRTSPGPGELPGKSGAPRRRGDRGTHRGTGVGRPGHDLRRHSAEGAQRGAGGAPLPRQGRRARSPSRSPRGRRGTPCDSTLTGQGDLGPLAPWLPAALVQAPRAAPLDVRAHLGLSPGDRAAGRASAKLGDLATVEGTLSFQDKQLRVDRASRHRGPRDRGLGWRALAGPVQGRAELADGEVTWAPERGGWPEGRATLRLLEATRAGLGLRARRARRRSRDTARAHAHARRGQRCAATSRGGGSSSRGWSSRSVSSPLRVDIGAGGVVSRAGAVWPDGAGPRSARAGRGDAMTSGGRGPDARLETATARLDPIVRRLGSGWLGPSDQLQRGERSRRA